MLNTTRRLLAIALALVALPLSAHAQGAYPNKPITLIVPFPPGGNVDLSACILAPELATRLNQVLANVLMQPGVKEQFARLGAEVKPGTPAEYAAFIRLEITRTAKIVKDAKITLE